MGLFSQGFVSFHIPMTSQYSLFESFSPSQPPMAGAAGEAPAAAWEDPCEGSVLPRLIPLEEVSSRLSRIFRGLENSRLASGVPATRTIFAMLYIGAVDGDAWLRPCHVMRLGDAEATVHATDLERAAYRRKQPRNPNGWYAENSREGARDDIIRKIYLPYGALIRRQGIAQNNQEGRYALASDFAALLDPFLSGDALEVAIQNWRDRHLSPEALARAALLAQSRQSQNDRMTVTFPDGRGRILPKGPGPALCKRVVEGFASEHLYDPVVVAVTEGAKELHAEDAAWLETLRIKIDPSVLLPDIILVDRGDGGQRPFKIVFVEAAATGGHMTEDRSADLYRIAESAGYRPESVRFVTAFDSRDSKAFKKAAAELPLESFGWFANEPKALMSLLGRHL